MIGVLIGALSVSLTWFAKMNSIDDLEIGGSVLSQYFDSGTGTDADPFVITRPKHWENLVWLHNNVSNFYQAITDNEVSPEQQNDQGYYFQVGKLNETLNDGVYYVYDYTNEGLINPNNTLLNSRTLNLQGLGSLIPIGCDTKPFLGVLNGHGICVSGFDILGYEDINYNLQHDVGEDGFNDVGIFGYIGNDSAVNNIYFDNFTIHLANASSIRSNNSQLHNESFHTSVEDGDPDICFAGYIAGHMHYSSSVEDVYINNCTIESGCASTVGFGYFGVVEEQNGNPKSTPLQEIQEIKQAGADNNFGGSLDFYTVYERLSQIYATAPSTSYYVDNQTLVVNDKTGTLTGETKDLNDPDKDSIYHHETQVTAWSSHGYKYVDYDDYGGGVFNFSDDNDLMSSNNPNIYQCLNGFSTHYTKTVTTYTFSDTAYGCFLIQNGDYYLNHRYYPTVQAETDENYAAGWNFTGNDTGNLYTKVFDVTYYLNRSNYSLTMSTTPSTTWTKNTDGEIYTVVNGANYYIDYDNGWCLSPYKDRYTINDGNGHYLTCTNSNIGNSGSAANATKFILANPSGDTTILFKYNNNYYYLSNTNESLAISTTAKTWNKEGDYYYTTIQGHKYFLVYSGGWTLQVEDGVRLGDGNNHYITSTNNSAVSNTGTLNNSVIWHFSTSSGDTQIYYISGGTKYYLNHSNAGALSISSSSSSNSTWKRNGDGLYFSYGNFDYYLTYSNNAWRVVDVEYYTINDGNGHYLSANGSNTFSNANASGATHFYFQNNPFINPEIINPYGTINYVYNGTIYYLNLSINGSSGTLQSSNSSSSTSWLNNGNSIYFIDNEVTYFLEYNNGWVIRRYADAGYITDGTNYMTVSGTTIGNTTDVNAATLFVFSISGTNPSGTIRALGTTTYLTNNNGSLRASSTATIWENNGSNFYNGNYYLKFYDGSWTLDTDNYVGFYIAKGDYYLIYNGSSLLGSTTPSTIWIPSAGSFSSDPGTIRIAGSTNQYLYISTGSGTTVSVGSSRSWILTNGTIAYRYSNRYYYISAISTSGVTATRTGTNGTVPNSAALTFTQAVGYSKTTILDNTLRNTISTKMEVSKPQITRTNYAANKNSSSDFSHTEDYSLQYSAQQLQECIKSTETNVKSGQVTYFPLRVDKVEGTNNYPTGWPASDKNTGYIISGSNLEGSSSTDADQKQWGDIRISGWAKSNIAGSYSNGAFSTIYTVDGTNSNTIRQLNANEKADSDYQHALSEFGTTLTKNSRVFGIHFMDAAISTNHTLRARQAKILGQTYYDYELPEDSIDFNVYQRGKISFFAGEYFTNNNAFFSLHRIFRDSNNNITSIKEISEIYAHSLRPNKTNYVYKFTDNTYTNANGTYTGETTRDSNYSSTPVFKTSWIKAPSGLSTSSQRLFYFSIPCNAGEYALGSVSGKTGAYLCYLDIAANGGDAVLEYMKDPVSINAFDVDFRSPGDVSPHCIIQLGAELPTVSTNTSNLQVSVIFVRDPSTLPNGDDYKAYYPTGGGIYIIRITNKTGQMFKLSVLLVDDDDDLYSEYTFAYRLIYTNEDHTDTVIDGTTLYDGLETEVDFWQRMAIFDIPSSGEAVEDDYKDE